MTLSARCDTYFLNLWCNFYFFKIKKIFFHIIYINKCHICSKCHTPSMEKQPLKHGKSLLKTTYFTMNQMIMNNRKPHHGQPETPSAGVTLVAATNIHLHGRGQREGWVAGCKRPRPTPSPGFWPYLTTFHGIVQNDIPNRIVRYPKSYSTISRIV